MNNNDLASTLFQGEPLDHDHQQGTAIVPATCLDLETGHEHEPPRPHLGLGIDFDLDLDFAADFDLVTHTYESTADGSGSWDVSPPLWESQLPMTFGTDSDQPLVDAARHSYIDPRSAANVVLSANPYLSQAMTATANEHVGQVTPRPMSQPLPLGGHESEIAVRIDDLAHVANVVNLDDEAPSTARYPGAEYLDFPDSATTLAFSEPRTALVGTALTLGLQIADRGGGGTEIDLDVWGETGWMTPKMGRSVGRPKGSRKRKRSTSDVDQSEEARWESGGMTVPAAKRPLSSRPIRDAPELRRELLVASAAYSSRLVGIIERTDAEILFATDGPGGSEKLFEVIEMLEGACQAMLPGSNPSASHSARSHDESAHHWESHSDEELPDRDTTPKAHARESSAATPADSSSPRTPRSSVTSPLPLALSGATNLEGRVIHRSPTQRVRNDEENHLGAHLLAVKRSPPSAPASLAVPAFDPIIDATCTTKMHGPWHPFEVSRLTSIARSCASHNQTEGQEQEKIDWDLVIERFGPSRSKHQILLKAVEQGLKASSTRPSRKAQQMEKKASKLEPPGGEPDVRAGVTQTEPGSISVPAGGDAYT